MSHIKKKYYIYPITNQLKLNKMENQTLHQQVWAIYNSGILSPMDNVRMLKYYKVLKEEPNNVYHKGYLAELMDYANQEIQAREQLIAARKALREANLKKLAK